MRGLNRSRRQGRPISRKHLVAVVATFLTGGIASGQILLKSSGSAPLLGGADLSILELKEPRQDMTCMVEPIKPNLGFDLRFHSGYDIAIPLKELAGSENLLTVVFRVIPDSKKDSPVYMTQKIRVPAIEQDAKGAAYLQGSFDVGEGNYTVEWLMRDRSERYCSSYWNIEAALPPKDKSIAVELPASEVAASQSEQFTDEPPVERQATESPLNVKVLVNFAPQNALASTLQPMDTIALSSMLKYIQRDPRLARFSVVAFNLQEQRVLYRQEQRDRIDMPALGDAVKHLQLGKVSVETLANKNAETDFLSELIKTELSGKDRPDALIFAGPRAPVYQKVDGEALRSVGQVDYPIFYMNYTLNPQANPFRDSISHAVKYFRGEEFMVSRPRDLWFAVSEMVTKIVRFKSGKRTAAAAYQ